MQTWQTPEHAGLLADVQLGGPGPAPTTVAWCPVNGLLAVGDRQHASLARVHLISPCCPQHKVTLAVPLQGPEDDLVCVTWSPVGCRRVLLTATKLGAVSAWTQLPPPAGSGARADMQAPPVFTLGDWWCHSVGQLLPAPSQGQQQQEEWLLSMQWLQPPPCWPYSNRVLQEHDFQAGSVPNMFAPAAPRRRPAGSLSALEQAGSNLEDPAAELHWVEPGTLAFAAVLSSGKAAVGWATWSVMGQLRWQVSPSIPLLPAAVGADAALLLTADATWSPSGVAVAMTTQQQPSTVHVVELQGNPLHHQCLGPALRSQVPVLQAKALAACIIPAAAPCTVVSICWDPNSDAQRLVTATCSASSTEAAVNGARGGVSSSRAGPGHVTLLSLTEQQQQQQPGSAAVPPTYLLAPLKATPVTHTPRPKQWAWLLDGLLVGQQLLDRQTLAPLAISFEQPATSSMQQQHRAGPELQVLADSPHGVAVAMVQLSSSIDNTSSSNSSSVLVYSIPPVSKAAAGGEVAPTLAGRLVWSLLQQRHSWDLVQHLQQAAQPAGMSSSQLGPAAAAAGADLQAQRVAQVLGLVDRKLAVQPKEVYSMYAARWDALKYAVVARTPGGEARAFSIDLRLRLLVPVLEHHLTAAAREEEARPGAASTTTTSTSSTATALQQQQQQQQQGIGSSATAALAEYAMSVLDFEMACINTWIHRRLAAAAAAAGTEGAAAAERSVKAVPCIRFCLDFRSNAKLATTGHKATDLAKLPRTSRVYQLWKLLHKASDGRTEPPAGWEDWLLDVVPGPFELHSLSQPCQYPSCIINLRLPADQLLRHMQCSPEWQQVPVLTDADITARATRLGLLPPNTLAAQAKYAQQARLHARFRLQLPPSTPPLLDEAAAAAAAAAPRPDALQPAKRGATAGAGTAAAKRRRWERQLRDAMGCTSGGAAVGSDEVVDLVNMGYASPSTLPLQSVDGAVQAQSDRASKAASTWAYACPVTGEVWLLV